MKKIIGLLVLGFWISAATVSAQDTTGNLEGVIVDENGDPLMGANVRVTGVSVQGFQGRVSGEDGRFRLLALPVGVVEVRITYVGFETVTISVRIHLGETASLGQIPMQPEAVTMGEVLVTGQRPAIDLTSTTIGANMNAEVFSALPIDREISSVAAMLPQANTSYLGDQINIGGATGNENAYYFDGVNAASPIGGRLVGELPYNFVREIQIKTGGYDAEYGRAMGGIITVLTESGSNTVKASAFGFLSNNRLTSDTRKSFQEQVTTGDFQRYDAGFGIGGPILRDRLWYYVAYNRKIESQDVRFDALGVRSEESVSNIFATKLSWRASDQTNLVLSAFGDPTTGDHIGGGFFWNIPNAVTNEDTMLGRTKSGTYSVALNATHVFGDDLLLEGTASWFKVRGSLEPATEYGATEPFFVVDSTGIWSGGFPGSSRTNQRRAAVSVAGTWYVGSHSFKAGFQYEDNFVEGRRIVRSENGPNVETITGVTSPFSGPPGAGAIAVTGDNSWMVFHMNDGASNYSRNTTAFAQTRLQLSENLSATMGLRWDRQAFRSKDFGYGFDLIGEWQPRLGLIYEPGDRGTQKVFAHVGRFVAQVPISSSMIYMVPPVCWYTFFDHDPMVDPTGGSSFCTESSPAETLIDGNLSAMYYDAVTAGYQRLIGSNFRIGISGTLRSMGEVLGIGLLPSFSDYVMGNPGSGRLDFLPEAVRDYAALELTVDRVAVGALRYGISYVLSRNHGNFSGGGDTGNFNPNASIEFSTAEQVDSAGEGPLPNDRTHVFKLHGSYATNFGLTASTYFTWQTGTPLSELSVHPWVWWDYTIIGGRGGMGRTPSIWDMSFRFTYDVNHLTKQRFRQKVILDILHAFNRREVVDIETLHHTGENDGVLVDNPNYLQPIRFQIPMTIRLGVEIGF